MPTYQTVRAVLQSPSHPLHEAQLKCDTASRHLRSLKMSVTKYKNNPAPLFKTASQDGRTTECMRWPRPAPESWGTMLSDFAVNLRSALDFIAWQLAVKHYRDSAQAGSPGRYTKFPICDSADDYAKQSLRSLRDVLPGALPLIERLQPYNQNTLPETRLLSLLRELANTTKHQSIIMLRRNVRLMASPGTSVLLRIPLDGTLPVVRGAEVTSGPLTSFRPPASLNVTLEIPSLSAAPFSVAVLDDIYRFVGRDMLSEFVGLF